MKQLKLFRYISFILFFIFFTSMPLSVSAADDDLKLTLDDYLESGNDIFVQRIEGKEYLIRSALQLSEWADKYCYIPSADNPNPYWTGKGSDGRYHTTYIGPAIPLFEEEFYEFLAAEALCKMPDDVKYLGYSNKGGSGGRGDNGNYSDDVSVNSRSWLSLISFQLKSRIERLEKEYDEVTDIYGGFFTVGYDAKNVFGVSVKDNEYWSDVQWNSVDRTLYSEEDFKAVKGIEEDKPSKIEKIIAAPLGNAAWNLYRWMRRWNVDITIDGLVYGRMSNTYTGTADFTHFGLETNNPYGVVGSTVFYVLRRILLSVIPIIVMILLIMNLFRNGKKRALLKEDLQNVILVLVMLFAAPYIVNFMIYVRDGIIRYTSMGMAQIFASVGLGSISVGGSVIGCLYLAWNDRGSLLNAILLLSGVGSCLFYLVSYLKIAILLMGCFAVLPLVLFKAIWDKKIIKEWWNIYFPNMCVPLVDLILLQIPSVILLIYKKVAYKGGGGFVLGIVLMLVIWSLIPIRDRIIKLLGFDGIGGRGAGALMAAAMMAMRSMRPSPGKDEPKGKTPTLPNANGGEDPTSELQARSMAMDEAREDMLPKGGEISLGEREPGVSDTDRLLGDVSGGSDGADVVDDAAGEGAVGDAPLNPVDGADAGAGGDVDVEPDAEGVRPEVAGGVIADDGFSADEKVPVGAGADVPGEITGGEQASPAVSMSDKDKEFAESLGEEDRSRFMNLKSLDACNEELARNEAAMRNQQYSEAACAKADADVERRTAAVEQAKTNENMAKLKLDGASEQVANAQASYDREIANLESARGTNREGAAQANVDKAQSILDKKLTDEKVAREAYNGAISAREGAEKGLTAAQTRQTQVRAQVEDGKELARRNAVLRAKADECMKREQAYAHIREVGGMSSRTYKDAASYKHATRVEQAQRQLANYSNFDTKRYEGVLTPAEREQFYRDRVFHERAKSVGSALKSAGVTAAAVSVASTAAVVAAYGGPNAMVGTAVGATTAGRTVVNTAIKTGGTVITTGQVAHEAGSRAVQKVASRVAQRNGNGGNRSGNAVRVGNPEAETARRISERAKSGERRGESVSERKVATDMGARAKKAELVDKK